MIRPIVRYGHPALRQRGARIDRLGPDLRQLVADMFETMYDAKGIGLAAHQVARPLQLAVLDIRGIKDRPSTLWLDGKPAEPEAFMPLVLINPEVKPLTEPVSGPEGCLSFPEIYADISRAEQVEVKALNAEGRTIIFRCGGLLAKAIQHELDHLHGILFVDRMNSETKAQLQAELDTLMTSTKAALQREAEEQERQHKSATTR